MYWGGQAWVRMEVRWQHYVIYAYIYSYIHSYLYVGKKLESNTQRRLMLPQLHIYVNDNSSKNTRIKYLDPFSQNFIEVQGVLYTKEIHLLLYDKNQERNTSLTYHSNVSQFLQKFKKRLKICQNSKQKVVL